MIQKNPYLSTTTLFNVVKCFEIVLRPIELSRILYYLYNSRFCIFHPPAAIPPTDRMQAATCGFNSLPVHICHISIYLLQSELP